MERVMWKKVTGVVLALSLALFATSAVAGGKGKKGKWSKDPEQRAQQMKERALERLDLALQEAEVDEKQRVEIQKIALSLEPELRATHKLNKQVRDQIKAEMLKEKPDLQAVHDLVNESSAQLLGSGHKAIVAALKAHALLSPEQRKSLVIVLDQDRSARQAKWASRKGEMGGKMERRLGMALTMLDASEDQIALVNKHKGALMASGKKVREQSESVRAELIAEFVKDKPDIKRMHSLVDNLSVSMTALAHDGVEAAGEVWLTATPAQREKVRAFAERRGR